MAKPPAPRTAGAEGPGLDLHGVSRLAIDAVLGVTAMVEALHRTIASGTSPLGPAAPGRTRGITGLVYRSVGGITKAVGWGLDATLPRLAPLLAAAEPVPRRDATLAALNGVLGDHLAESGNPLAISMALRQNGRPLVLERATLPACGGKLLVLVHGLCMNDLQWLRHEHDHGAALARDLGYVPLYLHYNSGRHVSTNGEELSRLLEQLVQAWPVPVERLVLVGHSMGGLVSRSACHAGAQTRQQWLRKLRAMVFLGTPHHGAPLERAGSGVDTLLDLSPYTAPFGRIGRIRSAGIQDLRHGRLLQADWQAAGRARTPVPLPPKVRCYAVAATRRAVLGRGARGRGGDGLVPVASALGEHADPALCLHVPPDRQWVGAGMNHFDLLSSAQVYEKLRTWLG